MKLSVSNIAWPAELNADACQLLVNNDIRHLELAPTKIWPEWEGATPAAARTFRRSLADQGLSVSSLQSILYQKPGLQLFGDPGDRSRLLRHLVDCAALAAELGAACMVFGAPRNRTRGTLAESDALAIAAEFFSQAAPLCAAYGVCIGFEPNPEAYGCDFATQSATAASLVRQVNSTGFRLHLDSACMLLANETNVASVIASSEDILAHFHCSEPNLGTFASPVAGHLAAAEALRQQGYAGFVALEMRPADPPLPALEEAIRFMRRIYG